MGTVVGSVGTVVGSVCRVVGSVGRVVGVVLPVVSTGCGMGSEKVQPAISDKASTADRKSINFFIVVTLSFVGMCRKSCVYPYLS